MSNSRRKLVLARLSAAIVRRGIDWLPIAPPTLLWILFAVWLWLCGAEFFRLATGPVELSLGESALTPPPGRYVTIHAERVERIAVHRHKLGDEPYSYYGLVHSGGATVLVCFPPHHTGNEYTGIVEPHSRWEREILLPRVAAKQPQARLAPWKLNMVRPVPPPWVWMSIAPALLAGATALFLTRRLLCSQKRRRRQSSFQFPARYGYRHSGSDSRRLAHTVTSDHWRCSTVANSSTPGRSVA